MSDAEWMSCCNFSTAGVRGERNDEPHSIGVGNAARLELALLDPRAARVHRMSRRMRSKGDERMYHEYEVYSGDRLVASRMAATAQAALFDYVRSLGCQDEEVEKLAPDTISWRGAVFRAVQVSSEPNESD